VRRRQRQPERKTIKNLIIFAVKHMNSLPSIFNLGIRAVVLLIPAMSNRTCHAKLRVRRKSLNLRSPGANASTRRMQQVFAFGIALFASEQ